jgi:mRNA interferase RelE/StbE
VKIVYRQSFEKDLLAIQDKNILKRIKSVLTSIENISKLSDIPNLKKMHGHNSAYRIRVGNFRLRFFLENNLLNLPWQKTGKIFIEASLKRS